MTRGYGLTRADTVEPPTRPLRPGGMTPACDSTAAVAAAHAVERRVAVQLADLIIDMARELRRSVPSGRGAPYYLLDAGTRADLEPLGAFCTRGIFRKYEHALEIGAGLGGRARWMAARSGCRVLGIDPEPAVVGAAMRLNERARMNEQVQFQVGAPAALPVRSGAFTHVWLVIVGAAARTRVTPPPIVREAFRAVRPGGHLAVQCPAEHDVAQLVDTVCAAGFVESEVRRVSVAEQSQAAVLARERLLAALQAQPAARALWQRDDDDTAGRGAVHVYARRPA